MDQTITSSGYLKKIFLLFFALVSFVFSFAQNNIFPSTSVPAVPDANDAAAIEVGFKFRVTQVGYITGIRFYKSAANTGTHTGHLWTNTGTQLAEATFIGETSAGWQEVLFTNPVAVTTGITYVASYFSSAGNYSYTNPYFSSAIVNGPLRALANGEDGGNGLYLYTTTPAFPTATYQSSNYWVDIVFVASLIPDITPPSVNITAPTAGNVSGSVNVTANASDNIGVAGLQFLLDGVNLGAEMVTAPYTMSWNTTATTNGSHILTARVRDAAGNLATSSSIVVTVTNVPDTELPTITITAPTAGPVSGTVNVTANASDNIGVAGVQFLLNGANLGAEDLAAPYSISWNTIGTASGNYTLAARVRDAAGNIGNSFPVAVTIFDNNLVAAFGFNENTGTTTIDNSGNDNNGILTNGPAWSASGKYGSAILFDGTNDFVNINDASSLDLTNGMTMEAWVNPSNLTGFKTIICKDRTTTNYTYTLAANNNTTTVANQRPNSRARINNTNRTVTGTSKLPLNTWTHVASTYDGATFRLYIDGVEVSSLATTGDIAVTTDPLRIGGTTALSAQYFAGLIDEVRIYSRALTREEIETDMNTPIAIGPDITNPIVNITAPVVDNVSGTVNVTANASDNIGIAGVQFQLNGVNLGAEDVAAPYSVSWNTLTTVNGNYNLTAIARDEAGNTTTSAVIIVTVNNIADTQAPTVNITTPSTGTVSGTATVIADATDNFGITGVQFQLNGVNLGAEDFAAPYSVSWNTLTAANGNYTLTAIARDAAGNTNTSTGVLVSVINDTQAPTVSIATPVAGTVSGTVNVTANASDNMGIAGVQFQLNGVNLGSEDIAAPYSVSWNTLTAANGNYTVTAIARDSSGNTSTSPVVVVIVANAPDTQGPVVSITGPAAGNVSGIINVTANASDNRGVAGVQFLLNGATIGTEDITEPYSVSWNTATATNGSYTLTARARDAAGNTTISAGVTVTVSNATNLIAALNFNEGTGTTTADISGNNHTGTLTNGPTWTTGKYGQGITLDGTNDYVNIADHNNFTLDPAQSYTWSGWLKNNNFTEWSTVWSQTVDANNFFYFYAHTTTDPDGGPVTNGISVYWWAGGGTNKLGVHSNNNVLTAGQWSHVAVTYNASQPQNNRFSIYVNGIDVTNRTDVASTGVLPVINPANIRIGSNQPFGEYLNGSVDEVRYYNRLLTAAEVVTDMNTPIGNDNIAPTVNITTPATGTVSGTATVIADATDNFGITGVQFQLNGVNLGAEDFAAPYSVSWNTLTAANGNYTLTAIARDAAGNTNTSTGVLVSVINDTQAPTVSIATPVAGTVSGTVNVTANASDNMGIAGVQFQLNGVNLGSEDIAAPYSVSWNTLTAANGNYTVTAIARDSSGNTSTSPVVVVIVANAPDTQGPVVSITGPAAGNVSGIINVTANASDNRGVAGVQFLLNGATIGTEDITEPYSVSWNTATATNGSYTLTARARDAAGNTTISAGVTVTVSNATNLIAALNFNEGTGTTTADISGNNHTGTLTNGPTWTTGKYGQGITLDGTNDYVNIADHNNFTLDPAQSYTWSGWLKNNNFTEWSTVWSQTVDANNFFYFYAHTTTDPDGGPVTNGISVYWWAGGGTNKLGVHSNNNVLTAGQWSHVAVTYNASQPQNNRFSIYVNGIDVTNRTDVASTGVLPVINSANIRIGSNQPFGEYLNGSVDEVRYYNRLLTAAEVVTDMNTPIGVNDNTAPTVTITSPAAGNVTGTINVNANASDNTGVAGVQFLLDGINLGTEDIAAPYSVAWNTSTATGGTHILTARARDAAGNNTTSAAVNVIVPSDFSFALLNASRNVDPTGSTDFGVIVTYLNGFTSSNVVLSVSGLPSGVTGNYAINPMTNQGQTQLLINTNNATPGVYTLTLTATAASIVHSQQATLVINGAGDFALSASPAVQNVVIGSGTSYFINITETGDFTSPVNLTITGLPATMTASFNPASAVPAATSVLTITTSGSTPTGTYNFTVQGVSGAFTRTLPISLTVLSAPPTTWPITSLGSGWDMPLGTVFSKDGQKLFVWEKGGKLFVCNRNATTQLYDKQTAAVLDISAEVGNWGDMGLLGFALDPSFETNGLIYVSYIVDRHYLLNFGTPAYNPPPGDNASANKATIGRVTRYQIVTNGGIMNTNYATRTILLGETIKTGIPILYDSHGVGSLAFAADGTLIVSCGDGASYATMDGGSVAHTYYVQALADEIIRPNENVGSFRSQMLTSLNGKILRLNPANGDGVSSNPFYDAAQPRSAKSRVYALGLRNPYRFSIKPGTGSTNPDAGDIGEIYAGDVGMGTWEELNIIKEPGMNCGWPFYEGHSPMPEFNAMITENKDEPNPLYNIGGCTQRYYTFQNLFRQATADNIKTVYNPCNPSQPIGTGNLYVHRRPLIDTKHGEDIARVGIFNGNIAGVATIGTAASNVTGTPYRGNAVIGGVWYTGNLFPANFRNTFLYGDYGRSWIKSLTVNFTDVLQKAEHFADAANVVSIAENPLDGTLVYVDIGNNLVNRISYGGNQFPVVKMTSNAIYGPSPLNVTFTGNNSFDPEGGRLTYSWNFGDGTAVSTLANPPVHSFAPSAGTPRKYVVTLTVKDSVNATATDSIIISVNNTAPVVNITSPVKNSIYTIGLDSTYSFTATVTDAEHNAGQLKYEWQLILRHNTHEHPGPIDTVRNTFGSIARIGCNGDTYYWLIRLKVTDAAGLYTIDSSKIFPNCVLGRVALALRKFSVTQQTNENLVKWMTDMAPQIKGFEVERSVDDISFSSIYYQPAANRAGVKEYSFSDKGFSPGVNYYRLKMIEIGDVIRYSATVKTFTEIKGEGLVVSPNPVTGNFSLRYTAHDFGPVTIRIRDINGRLFSVIHESVNKGQNIIYLQTIPEWTSGMYLVSVQQGNDIQQVKLIKAK